MARRNHRYTGEQVEYLREITPGRGNKEITEMFNIKYGTNIDGEAIRRVRLRHGIKTGLSGRFKEGQIPWNKGKTGYMGANKTSFKKGEFSYNREPIGSRRVTEDGYIQIKIQDGKEHRNWRGKHILEWEKVNGPLPAGYVIIFGDGDRRNFDISNLICVSRKQLLGLNRHNLIQDDAKLTKAAINIVDLNYKISEVINK